MGWITFGQGFQAMFSLLVGAMVARYLGPHDFGLLSLAASLVGLGGVAANLGLEMVTKKQVLDEPENKHIILGTSYGLKVLAASGFFLIMVLSVWPGEWTLWDQVFLLTGGMLLFEASRVVDFWFQSQIQAKFSTLVVTITLVFFGVIRLGLIGLEASVAAFAACWIGYGLMGHLGYMVMYTWQERDLVRWRFSWGRARILLGLSWPLIFNAVNAMLYARVDQIMLGSLGSMDDVGVYAAAVRILEMTMILPVAFCSTLFPKIVHSSRMTSEEERQFQVSRFFRCVALLAYVVALGLMVLGPWGIRLLFGEAYAAAGTVLRIFAAGLVFKYLICARGQIFVSENIIRLSLVSSTIGLLVNIVANLVLIPRFGLTGAASATFISLIATLFCVFVPKSSYRWIGLVLLRSLFLPLRFNESRQD
jgi:PST family polysaccharide transporter